MAQSKVVIEVQGGVVQEVYASDRDVQVVLVDWDADDVDDSERVVKVKDSEGRDYRAWAADFPVVPLDVLPQETRQAVEQAKG